MKNVFINLQKAGIVIAFFLLFISGLTAQSNIQQSLSVNSSGAAADASAQLDVSATDKGMLVPRMTSAQRTAIASPATGLLVFDTDTGGFWFYNGTAWTNLSAPKTLADADNDTKIQVEESPDEDIIRFDLAGAENMVLRKNAGGSPRLELHNPLSNTFVGKNAGNATSTGSANTALGTDALAVNTIGESNTAVGRSSLLANTDGSNNVAIGDRTLFANSTGTTNVAMGATTMLANTTGSHNTAIGTSALPKNTTGYSNTAIGRRALFNSTFNSNLVAVGDSTLFSSVSGAENVALGSKALFANTSGSNNTATGYQALFANTTGSNNTALGNKADVLSGTLTNATAIGYNAKVGASNSLVLGGTGADKVNVGIGTATPAYPLHLNAVGNGFTHSAGGIELGTYVDPNYPPAGGWFGTFSDHPLHFFTNNSVAPQVTLLQNGNFGIGTSSPAAKLHVNGSLIATGISDADNNTKVQVEKNANEDIIRFDLGGTENLVLRKNAGGSPRLELPSALNNNFIGINAGTNTTTGSQNTAFGNGALFNNSTGFSNLAIGPSAMNANLSGSQNTAVGGFALFSSTAATENTAIGTGSLSGTTGNENSGIGVGALTTNTTGAGNTGLGKGADVSAGNLTNATAIGYNATVNASNKVRIGNTSVTVIEGQVDWTFPSDARFKFNVHDDKVPGLAFIEKLRPVTYQFDTRKFDEHLMQNMPDSIQQRRMAGQDYSKNSAIVQTGFLAQEVEEVCKKLGYEFSGLHVPESETDNYGLAYGSFVPLLVKAVQEQQKEIEKLEIGNLEIEKLKAENAAQKAENAALKAQLDAEKSANALQSAQLAKITAALAGAGIAVEK